MRLIKRLKQAIRPREEEYPNVHLPGNSARLIQLPGSQLSAYVRPSFSDDARVREYSKSIYFSNSYLHDRLKNQNPLTIIDIGANIGLSSLSLLKEFTSVRHVVAVEAEDENFEVLRRNFSLWEKQIENVKFEAVHAIATAERGVNYQMSRIAENDPKTTASGTFRFTPTDDGTGATKTIAMNDLMATAREPIICKMDIEGGEKFIFDADTSWMKKVSFFTAEVHDRFGPELIDSSSGMIAALTEFAIVPDRDVLHCYRRKPLVG